MWGGGGACHAHARPTEWWSAGQLVHRVEEWGTWASHTQAYNEASCGLPEGGGGAWAAKTVQRSPQPPPPPPLWYANYWAPRTRKRQEPQPQQLTECSNPTQHAKGRMGDCPGPRKVTAARWNVTQGGWAIWAASC